MQELRNELKEIRRREAVAAAAEVAAQASAGVVVARLDGHDADGLRQIALAVRDHKGVDAVVLIGTPDGGSVSLVAAVTPESGRHAGDLIADAAKAVKGGGGRNADLAIAGGKDVSGIDTAVALARTAAGGA